MAFGLFKKKKASTSKAKDRYFDLKIKEVVPVAKDAVNLVFEQPGEGFQYQSGQFITIIDTVQDKKIRRAYSLCSSPEWDEQPAVTVKRVPGGLMSNHINDEYAAGREVQVMEPMGMFTTDFDEDKSRHIVLIGGGSGITPLYSILKSLLKLEPKTRVDLIYGNRSEAFVIFKDELSTLDQEFAQLSVHHILEEASDWANYTGRPDVNMVKQIVGDLSLDKKAEVFICGPEPMMNVFEQGLKEMGIEDSQIHIESFEAGKTSPSSLQDDPQAASEGDCEVTLVVNEATFSVTMDRNRPILAQALEKDIDMPYSCQSGLCTACRGKCVEGSVSVDQVMGLTEKELQDNYVLACVGKPLSDRVKLEIG
jgi:ring-1,2-phenylacetyl-CoA epoxidase subunit PaaE